MAVMDAAGSQRATVVGMNDGATVAMLLAATHPERVSALVLFNGTARMTLASDYPIGIPMDVADQIVEAQASSWITGDTDTVASLLPSRSDDARLMALLVRLARSAVRPGAFAYYFRQSIETDLRAALATIAAPTLVLHRESHMLPTAHGRYLADHIANARYVPLPGEDYLPFGRDIDLVADEIEEFLTGARSGAEVDRILATLLFTDIVGSTTTAAEMGDQRWRQLLDIHDAAVRSEVQRARGREISTTGDGFLIMFDGPARAIRCGRAIIDAVRAFGVEVRAGIHTGECEVRGDDLGGLAVHIAARVAALAGASELLVSSTVKDLVAGSGIEFQDRGNFQLKGVPGEWRLFTVL
jgi:class 3 adenylate cyclase